MRSRFFLFNEMSNFRVDSRLRCKNVYTSRKHRTLNEAKSFISERKYQGKLFNVDTFGNTGSLNKHIDIH